MAVVPTKGSLDLLNPRLRPMTEADAHALVEKGNAFDAMLQAQMRAKYKIEVVFQGEFTRMASLVGVLSLWESGSKLHGGGDAAIHFCPGKHLKLSECESIIPEAAHATDFLVCPRCGTRWESNQVYGQVVYRLTLQNWAHILHAFYIRLGGNADVVIKRFPGQQLRKASELEKAKSQHGERFAVVRGNRTRLVYPLANIIKDTAAGAGLYDRFHAFLKAV